MKKSGGSPSRMRTSSTEIPVRQETVTGEEGPRRWKSYAAAAGVVVLLILMILPCQYRRCGGAREEGRYAYRWIVSGIPPGTFGKMPAGFEKRPYYKVRKDLHTSRRTAPSRDMVPAGRPGKRDTGDAQKKGAVKPPVRDDQLGKIETDEGGALKPKEKPKDKPMDKPKVYDFGTKLELVLPPDSK